MRKHVVWACLCAIVAVGLTACGGGGSGSTAGGGDAETMTLTVSSAAGSATTTYTVGAYNTQGFLDPNLTSNVTPSGNTFISMSSGVSSTDAELIVGIYITGNTPQTYTTGNTTGTTQLSYRVNGKPYSSIFSATTGTVTLTSVGGLGGKITGSFDAVVSLMTNSSDALRLSGTFSMTRDN